jgi:uncharacterized membrane protein
MLYLFCLLSTPVSTFAIIWKYLSVFLLSMVKFIGGPIAGIALDLPFYQTFALTVCGMMTSVVLFSVLGRAAQRWYMRKILHEKTVFSKRNRFIVKIHRKFGVQGIAFITPVLLSPIFGTIVALLLGVSKLRIFVWMLASSVFWGLILTYAIGQLRNVY